MRKIVSKFALAAGLVLAMALTFSCSSDDGGSSRATYWYSMYGIPDASSTNYIFGLANQNASYNDVKYVWSEIKRIGIWIESYNGVSEQEIKDFLIQRDASPKEADDFIARLKKRGNSIAPFNSNDPRYYMFMFYVERE